MTPGIYPNISAIDYHKSSAMSAGYVIDMLHSQKKAKWNAENPQPPTPAQEYGTGTHAVILEPETVKIEPARPAVDFRLKENRAAKESYRLQLEEHLADPRPISVTAEDYEKMCAMRDSLMSNPLARTLFEHGQPEVSIWWDDNPGAFAYPILCRCRPDRLDLEAHQICMDIKTTVRSLRGIDRLAAEASYHIRAAFYVDGIKAITDVDVTYVYAVIEKTPPYCAGLYTLDDDALRLGRSTYQGLLRQYQHCLELDEWPGPVGPEVQTISLPPWVTR